ncbi:abortive phage infection protein [Streptomyces sp. WAC 06738]|uniref:abortive phage infection protein n=1 Tax=Streptomyces sp. WAC 06738 TaxID=2203210 RepID=UPI000F6BA587|nr:abortive phage infection protein [Streptomyces sp. WAC 06738]AZM49322.1 abortive phage infection protein [Streptomyces sp. WAC 06738]
MSRKRFLAGAAGLGAAAAIGSVAAANSGGAAEPARAAGGAAGRAAGGKGGVRYRSVCYTIGAGETPATRWSAARMRRDIRAIRDGLHANAVKVTGDGVARLTATAEEAAERGLYVRAEPTLGDRPPREILDHLAEVGRHAEGLRRQGAGVELSVGCEFWLFVPGIVPGADVFERIENIQNGTFDPVEMQRKLDEFTARAAAVGRSVFGGELSYAAAQDDEVDWGLFDIVGIDYYGYHPRPAGYRRDLRAYLRFGKPLSISEFGCCTYEGAPADGGMGWAKVDYEKTPPELTEPLVRSERTQAAYLTDVYDVIESMQLHSAHAFEFLTPGSWHWPDDPVHDLDTVSYAIVKPVQDTPGDPESPWHWEPKEAYHALASRYARAARR